MTYEEAKAIRESLNRAHDIAAAALKEASGTERGPMGLTPDHIKSTPEWKSAFNSERRAFSALRSHNMMMSRTFKKEIRADRANYRNAA